MPIMFCSATPALMKFLGNRLANSSTTPQPKSPVISMTGSPRSAAMVSSSIRMLRMLDLHNGLDQLLLIGVLVVPLHLVLHEGDALAFGGAADDGRRLLGI